MGLDNDSWSASFYINNVWDERGTTFVNNRWAERRFGVNQPRTFGVTFRKRFQIGSIRQNVRQSFIPAQAGIHSYAGQST